MRLYFEIIQHGIGNPTKHVPWPVKMLICFPSLLMCPDICRHFASTSFTTGIPRVNGCFSFQTPAGVDPTEKCRPTMTDASVVDVTKETLKLIVVGDMATSGGCPALLGGCVFQLTIDSTMVRLDRET